MAAAAAAAVRIARKQKEREREKQENKYKLKEDTSNESIALSEEEEISSKYKIKENYQWQSSKVYIDLGSHCEALTQNDTFNLLIIVVILVAGLLVGIQTYEQFEANEYIEKIDKTILAIFTIEIILKVIAEAMAPWKFFTNKEKYWNIFDLVVVVLCFPFSKVLLDSMGLGSPQLLRLMRLLRVMKLVKKIPQLQIIVMGLVGGMKSIGYILVLLMLIFYVYANIGLVFFRENDPYHFGSLHFAMLTLFRMATLEDWTDVMYINIYGCGSEMYTSGIYSTDIDEAVDGFGVPTYCGTSKANEVLAYFYFITFIIISALVMLSLFVGAVTMSMTESMDQMKQEQEAAEKKRRLQKAKKRAESTLGRSRNSSKGMGSKGMGFSGSSLRGKGHATSMMMPKSDWDASFHSNNSDTKELSTTTLEVEDSSGSIRTKRSKTVVVPMNAIQDAQDIGLRRPNPFMKIIRCCISLFASDDNADEEQNEMRILFSQAWDGNDPVKMANMLEKVESREEGFKHLWVAFAKNCRFVAEHSKFQNFIIFVILCASVTVGAQSYQEITPEMQTDAVKNIFSLIDGAILVIFAIEMLLKMVATRFKPWRYFYYKGIQGWNCFDYVVVAGTLLPGSGSMLTILRLLRLMRVLKLVKSLPALQVIVIAVYKGIGSIFYIAIILGMVFYLFAVLGMMFFKENDPWHFGDLGTAILTLFRCSTLEDWTDVMYINMFGCDKYGYGGLEDLCVAPKAQIAFSMIYFVIFTLIGALVLMTLFIGVVTTSMEEASNGQQEAKELQERVVGVCDKFNVDEQTLGIYQRLFDMLDLDGGGTIEEEELRIGLETIGKCPPNHELRKLVALVDDDGSGEIDIAEFVEFMCILKKKKMHRKSELSLVAENAKIKEEEKEKQRIEEEKQKQMEIGMDFEIEEVSDFSGSNDSNIEH